MRISELMPIKYYNYSMESSDGAMRNWASGSNLLRAGEFRQKQQLQKKKNFFFHTNRSPNAEQYFQAETDTN